MFYSVSYSNLYRRVAISGCFGFVLDALFEAGFLLSHGILYFLFSNWIEAVAASLCLGTKQASNKLEKEEESPSNFRNWCKI